LFSATLSHNVRELAFEHMNEPKYIEVEPEQKIAIFPLYKNKGNM